MNPLLSKLDSGIFFTKNLFGVWLCVEDCARALPLCRHVLAILGPGRSALAFARTRPQSHPAVLTLEAWSQLYESCAALAEQCGLQRDMLGHLLSYRYGTFDSENAQRLFGWSYKPGSEAQFMSFLWQEMMPGSLLSDPLRRGLSHATYVKRVGSDNNNIDTVFHAPQPIAVLAMDAVYHDGKPTRDEFFHLASLLVLDDGQVAFLLAFADDFEVLKFFQGLIFIGNHLCEVMAAASSLFGCPPWSVRGGELLWFGLDIAEEGGSEVAVLTALRAREGLPWRADLYELIHWVNFVLHPGHVSFVRNGGDVSGALDELTASKIDATQVKKEHLAHLFKNNKNNNSNNNNNNSSGHRVPAACTNSSSDQNPNQTKTH
ncbi:unnamed protein product [Polarella glacialis]|uniref:Uncharacterized protein n=1 Tax=Polarella glacialis TaxID=89957 RepID=A0A813G5G8_POLGL|nr:unnamed protein product [Polarella glacialis]